ncbi:MAG: extracellular solute-binding protein [Caldilineaceae bacterium]
MSLGEPSGGRVSLWHSWSGAQADALAGVLATFQEIHPDVLVQVTYIPGDEMLTRYLAAADSGLGPDMFLGAGEWTPQLAERHLIVDLARLIQSDQAFAGEGEADNDPVRRILTRYTPATLDAVRYGDGLYGLPQALNVQALLYNQALVAEPPATLDQLLAQAAQGATVGMSITFEDAFWGVPAFGGRLRDDEGRYILDRGGMANWLNWLKNAREAPGMILDADRQELRKRFRAQELALYIGFSDELPEITRPADESEAESVNVIGEEQLGVAPLPTGPTGNPGPFLRVNTFFFNTASSAEQFARAMALADFMTNAEQSLDFLRQGRLVPANTNVRVNPRLDPKMAAFVSQARSATPLPIDDDFAEFQRAGNASYRQVLEGLAPPAQAAIDLTQTLNRAAGVKMPQESSIACLDTGLLTIWDGATLANTPWEKAADDQPDATVEFGNDGLAQIIQQFKQFCPSIIVRRTLLTPTEWVERIRDPASGAPGAELLFGPHTVIPELADAERIQDITGRVTAEEVQQFLPNALSAMRYRGRLYGAPFTVDVQAMYYNKQLVADPISTLDDLARFANINAAAAIQSGFDAGYWGLSAFGDDLPPVVNGADGVEAELGPAYFALDTRALINWLSWLRSVQNTPGILISADQQELWDQFRSGDSAYYIGPSGLWYALEQTLGSDKLGVLRLPSGPQGESHSLLHTTGFLFNAKASDAQMELALKFVHFAASLESQQMLMAQMGHMPVNVGVGAEASGPVAIFAQSVDEAVVAPAGRLAALLESAGDKAYADVLRDGLQPTAAVANMATQLAQISQTDVMTPTADGTLSIHFGELQLNLLNMDSLDLITEKPE